MWSSIFEGIGSIAKVASVGLGVYSALGAGDAAEEAAQTKANSTTKYSRQQAQQYIDAAKSNAKVYEFDAEVAMKEAAAVDFQASVLLRQHAEQVHDMIGTQITNYAKSGVSPTSGSARLVIADTARKATIDSQMIRYNGMTAAEAKRDAARHYLNVRDASLEQAMAYANLLMESGSDEAAAILAQGQVTSDAYDIKALSNLATGVGNLYTSGTFDTIGSWFD